MTYQKQSYVEHVAVRVKDVQWHIRFFREALGMSIRAVDGPADAPKQVWTVGGVQLIADPDFAGIARSMVAELKDNGCSVIVAMTHIGLGADQDLASEVERSR